MNILATRMTVYPPVLTYQKIFRAAIGTLWSDTNSYLIINYKATQNMVCQE